MQVVNLTTPANYFHALRRQVRRNFRKPLVVMAPKSLLRHKKVVSKLAELGPDTRFRRVLPEAGRLVLDKNIRRVVLCSGKIYYDLVEGRQERAIKDVAIVRVEQLYPWPRQGVLQQLARYPGAEVVWCQEDPANMGAWTFAYPRLMNILDELDGKRPRLCRAQGIGLAGDGALGEPSEGTGRVDRAGLDGEHRRYPATLSPPEKRSRQKGLRSSQHGDRDQGFRLGRIGHRGDGHQMV